VRHDRRVVLERIADVAVLVGGRSGRAPVQLVRVVDVVIPLVAIILPGDVACVQAVADAPGRNRRDRERRVARVAVEIGAIAVTEIAGVVVVEQIVVAGFAIRIDMQ
jgi:hypothetical protein